MARCRTTAAPRSRFAVNPWTGSAANANVAANLLKDKLGYTVETRSNVDEYAQFKALSNGDLDATLEVWPSGHAADYAKYIRATRGSSTLGCPA